MKNSSRERNKTFTVLSAIGIVLILLGHLDLDVLTFGGLFPYYSYHVMIFVFISGYFYKSEDESHPVRFLIRKAKRLLLPYFIWNLVYGLISMLLRRSGFGIGEDISLYNLFVAPFMGGHQFGLNAPAWFIPALFLLEMCDMAARVAAGSIYGRVMCKSIKPVSDGNDGLHNIDNDNPLLTECIWMALYLVIGILAVYLAKRGSVYGFYKLPGRLMLMAPAFEFGRLYRTGLEKYDKVPSVIYIPVLFLINLILNMCYGGLAYSTVWVTGFGGSIITPFITSFTGIALWLRISKILSNAFTPDSLSFGCIKAVGENTYGICMHHLLVFMGIKGIIVLLNRISGICTDIDIDLLKNDVYYTYVPLANEGFKFVYLAAGIFIPVFFGIMYRRICVRKDNGRQKLSDHIEKN